MDPDVYLNHIQIELFGGPQDGLLLGIRNLTPTITIPIWNSQKGHKEAIYKLKLAKSAYGYEFSHYNGCS